LKQPNRKPRNAEFFHDVSNAFLHGLRIKQTTPLCKGLSWEHLPVSVNRSQAHQASESSSVKTERARRTIAAIEAEKRHLDRLQGEV
jgi:hypothetical protein